MWVYCKTWSSSSKGNSAYCHCISCSCPLVCQSEEQHQYTKEGQCEMRKKYLPLLFPCTPYCDSTDIPQIPHKWPLPQFLLLRPLLTVKWMKIQVSCWPACLQREERSNTFDISFKETGTIIKHFRVKCYNCTQALTSCFWKIIHFNLKMHYPFVFRKGPAGQSVQEIFPQELIMIK